MIHETPPHENARLKGRMHVFESHFCSYSVSLPEQQGAVLK